MKIFLFALMTLSFLSRGENPSSQKLTFEEAVRECIHSNLDLMASHYNVSLARADELTAGLWSNPSVLIDTVFQPFGGNWNQTNAGGPRQYDLIFSYPLDLSGKRSAAKKSAHEASEAAEASFQDAVRQKVLQVRLAYIDVMTFEHQWDLAKEKAEDLKRLVRTIQNRIGHRQLLPLLQMRAQLAQDQALLDAKQKENAFLSAKTILATLLGRAPESKIDLETGLRDFKLIEVVVPQKLIEEALNERPDLKALKLNLSKSDLDASLARAQIWDNFNLTAGLSSQGPISANPADPNSSSPGRALSWNAGLTIPLPLFNRGQGNLQKAIESKGQAQKQIEALELSIKQEVGDICRQLKNGQELIVNYESNQLKNARHVRDAQQKLFGTGSNALLDYFDAISAYVGTLSSYYDAVGDYRRAWARLNASLGKDWK